MAYDAYLRGVLELFADVRDSMHIPVLLHEVEEVLSPKRGEFFIDGTLGAGGHAAALLRRLEPGGTLLGVDWDAAAAAMLRADFQRNFPAMHKVIIAADNYANIPSLLNEYRLPRANGLLLDLGFSSNQLEGTLAGRGFSFLKEEPLRMTYHAEAVPVSQILQTISKEELRRVLFEYGEERRAAAIADAIVSARDKQPIATSGQLARIVEEVVGRRGRLHPATKTFQALRILANRELENLKGMLDSLPQIMASEGRVAIISFHSLEDRLVKQAFGKLEKERRAKRINKKPIIASARELLENPRSRSAKLRAITF